MGLFHPPALIINRLNEGYNANADFNTLTNGQTGKAKNVEVLRDGHIRKRKGYNRLLNTALTEDGQAASGGLVTGSLRINTSETGLSIRGHFFLNKSDQQNPVQRNIVAGGSRLFQYTSSTASTIMGGLNNDPERQWYFTQIQDPRPGASGTDDVVVGVNSIDNPIIWNGTEDSATFLSDVSGASGVAPARFITQLNNRIYLANIDDVLDVDSNTKILISGFSTTGKPTPHIFPPELVFYTGGSDRYGAITGIAVLQGELVIFKRNATYKFIPGAGTLIDTSSLIQMDENIGCIAPGTIATVGNFILFLSENGVYAFNGNTFEYISLPIEKDLNNVNHERITLSYGAYHRSKNQYWLSVSSPGSPFNDKVFVFDLTLKIWNTPYTGLKANIISPIRINDKDTLLSGDHQGYMYELDKGESDGLGTGFNFLVAGVSACGISFDVTTLDGFSASGDGLAGITIRALDGCGAGEERVIVSNTTQSFSVDRAWTSVNCNTSFTVGAIDGSWRSRDFSNGLPDIDKLYRRVNVRALQLGSYNFKTNYFVDFNDVSLAATATIDQHDDRYITLTHTGSVVAGGSGSLDNGLLGPAKKKINTISLRFIDTQPLTGKYFALEFSNCRANEPFEIIGFDIISKRIGRRTF